MVLVWTLVYWGVVVAMVVCAICFVIALCKESLGGEIFSTILGLIFLIFLLLTPTSPGTRFVQVGTVGDCAVIDKLGESEVTASIDGVVIPEMSEGHTTGDDIYVIDQDHTVVFTEDTTEIGKFRWVFGWREYRSVKDDVKNIVGEKDGRVYFVSKSTGEIKSMSK